MIDGVRRDVAALLSERSFPAECMYGPLPVGFVVSPCGTTIVFERDRKTGDRIVPPHGARKILTRQIGAQAIVYAASSKVGAQIQDHERECDATVDALLVALNDWAQAARANLEYAGVSELRYLTADEMGASYTQWPGVAYVVRFAIRRAVLRVDYAGQVAPTARVTTIRTGVEVRTDDPDNPRVVPMPDSATSGD